MTAFIDPRSTVLLVCVGLGSTFTALAPVSAAEIVIQMLGTGSGADPYRFEPAMVEIKIGDIVKWSNNFGSNAAHTATPDTGSEALLQPTGSIEQGGESAPQAITAAEPISYHCEYHPAIMKGAINVAK